LNRAQGLGVRAKTIIGEETSEFVIRESIDGNETLSLLHVDDLVQVVTSKRDEFGNITLEKHMMTKNIETFSHYRYDWLDTTKFLWWGVLGLGLIFLLIGAIVGWGITLGTLLFSFGLFFTLLQAADPEYIVFETSSGSHRFLVYRIRSNLPLTNLSMDLIDDAMQEFLRTGKLDTKALDLEAQKIEDQRIMIPPSHISVNVPTSAPPTVAPTSPPPTDPPTVAPTSPPPTDPPAEEVSATLPPPPVNPPTVAPTAPPPMLPPTVAPTGPPPMLPPTVAPTGPPPMLPPTVAPTGPPPITPPPETTPEFSEIPPPPPVDFSDIPEPPEVNELETVSEEDKNELLDVLK